MTPGLAAGVMDYPSWVNAFAEGIAQRGVSSKAGECRTRLAWGPWFRSTMSRIRSRCLGLQDLAPLLLAKALVLPLPRSFPWGRNPVY